MPIRALIAGALALLIGIQVVRYAAVRSLAQSAPGEAARIWPGYPDAQLSLGMIEIATATREGRPVDSSLVNSIYAVSTTAPLAPEPFLVRGVQAQLSGDGKLAERAFLEARRRDGRSLPAHYFLADHYFRERDAAKGLREIAAVARLVPGGADQLAPFVAQYAADPANAGQLRGLFRREPGLEELSLVMLAKDPRNAGLVLSLATPERRNGKAAWAPLLFDSLIRDGQYDRARKIWAELSGVALDPRELIYDPQFRRDDAPPPFNWTLNSSTVGLTERQHGGGLHVIYYGQESGVLASQLLTLASGRYRFETSATGASNATSLQWTLICVPTGDPIASIRLDQAIGAGWSFVVPKDCGVQRLELGGVLSDSPQQTDLVIRGVRLDRDQAGG